jgi:SAM-dependent methyltransferase
MHTEQFLSKYQAAAQSGSLVSCTLSRPVAGVALPDLKNVYLRPVVLKKGPHVAINFRYKTRDEVKNLPYAEAQTRLTEWLGGHFLTAELRTTEGDWSLIFDKKGQAALHSKAASQAAPADASHDKTKQRLLDPTAPWLHDLGITSARGEVLAHAQDKWRQINKFLEIVAALHRDSPLPTDAHIADMGSGKGYLTFALYDFLTQKMGLTPHVMGIELRPKLVDFCNEIAPKSNFSGLRFVAEDISHFESPRLDMLIALHACDTATDLALAKGIGAEAGVVMVAPCCHKQIRREMHPQNELAPVLRHGILEERQAEIVTDGIRALLLEANGYRTQVFEFISSEHTAKNVMITATRLPAPERHPTRRSEALARVAALKSGFGIRTHFLETLLGAPTI